MLLPKDKDLSDMKDSRVYDPPKPTEQLAVVEGGQSTSTPLPFIPGPMLLLLPRSEHLATFYQ